MNKRKFYFLFFIFLILPISYAETLFINLSDSSNNCYINPSLYTPYTVSPYNKFTSSVWDNLDYQEDCGINNVDYIKFTSSVGNYLVNFTTDKGFWLQTNNADLSYYYLGVKLDGVYETTENSSYYEIMCTGLGAGSTSNPVQAWYLNGQMVYSDIRQGYRYDGCGVSNDHIINETYTFQFDSFIIGRAITDDFANDNINYTEIYITNLTDVSLTSGNQLPTCNITVDSYKKCADATGSATFDLTLECSDDEGNTIYYSQYDETEEPTQIKLYDYVGRIDILEQDYFSYNDSLYTASDGTYCRNNIYHFNCLALEDTVTGQSLHMKNGIQDIFISVPKEILNSSHISYDFRLYETGVWDYVISDNSLNEIVTRYNYTDAGNLTVYIQDVLVYNSAFTNYTNNEFLSLTAHYYSTGYWKFDLDDKDSNLLFNYNLTTVNSKIKNLIVRSQTDYLPVANNYGIFDYFYISGYDSTNNFVFTTSYSDITQSNAIEHYKIRVSDSVHQPSSYNTYDLILSVDDSEDCTDTDITAIPDDEGNIIGTIDYILGGNIRYFLKYNNAYESGKKAIWILYLLFLIGALVRNLIATQELNLLNTIAFNSIGFGMLALLFGYLIIAVSMISIGLLALSPKFVGELSNG